MRPVLSSAFLLAVAASAVTASTVTASNAAGPEAGARGARPAAGPPLATRPSEPGPVRYRRGASASAYVPRTLSGTRVVGDVHEMRWRIADRSYGGAWTWQRIGSSIFSDEDSDAAVGLLIDPALAAPADAVWFWRASLRVPRGSGGCVRLYDASIQRAVEASRMCLGLPADSPAPAQTWIYDSPPIELNPGQHLYIAQGLQTSGPRAGDLVGEPYVHRMELVARWVTSAAATR